jgi:hypothetical protein
MANEHIGDGAHLHPVLRVVFWGVPVVITD